MFSRPVDHAFPIRAFYGEKNRRYTWSLDSDNGFWIPIKGPDGLGQHRGTDFDCPVGTVVRAMVDGIIIRTRFESSLDAAAGAGLYILQLVNSPGYDSWVLRYSHLKAVYVHPGKRVIRGEGIAESGRSGDAESPYLHVDLMNLKRQWRAIPLEA